MGNNDEFFKVGFSIWFTVCFVLCIWFLSSFIRGRRLFQNNLHVIEDGLKRMQEEIERRQRENSIGFDEDMKDMAEFCSKSNDFKNLEKQEESGLLDTAKDVNVGGDQPEEEDDKKNV